MICGPPDCSAPPKLQSMKRCDPGLDTDGYLIDGAIALGWWDGPAHRYR